MEKTIRMKDRDGKEQDELLTGEQVAEYLKVSKATIYRWRRENSHLPFITIGARIRYSRKVLDDFIERGKHPVVSDGEIIS